VDDGGADQEGDDSTMTNEAAKRKAEELFENHLEHDDMGEDRRKRFFEAVVRALAVPAGELEAWKAEAMAARAAFPNVRDCWVRMEQGASGLWSSEPISAMLAARKATDALEQSPVVTEKK